MGSRTVVASEYIVDIVRNKEGRIEIQLSHQSDRAATSRYIGRAEVSDFGSVKRRKRRRRK